MIFFLFRSFHLNLQIPSVFLNYGLMKNSFYVSIWSQATISYLWDLKSTWLNHRWPWHQRKMTIWRFQPSLHRPHLSKHERDLKTPKNERNSWKLKLVSNTWWCLTISDMFGLYRFSNNSSRTSRRFSSAQFSKHERDSMTPKKSNKFVKWH